jgi:hypothetical protein
LDSLTALQRYYLSRWGYEVLVMHEGLSLTQMQRLTDIYPRTSFYLLNLTFPPHINASSVSYQVAGHASIGYRHMCRFYSGGIFTIDVLAAYEWCLLSAAARLLSRPTRSSGTGGWTATAFCSALWSATPSASCLTAVPCTDTWLSAGRMNISQLGFGRPPKDT